MLLSISFSTSIMSTFNSLLNQGNRSILLCIWLP
uniref:Uncharacterized protein n=1 Tax=Brassica campestris TaxID=3711 RepID=A0A3P5Y1J9_BRACM|nr:unnamed protein product [Brassica rapa]